jgi:outer membrane immunogenic protein
MKKQLLLGVAFGALAVVNPAMAADLPVKAPIYKAAPAPVYNWTGCYAGGNVGYSWGRSSGDINIPVLSSPSLGSSFATSYSISADPQGVIGGVQIGCNRQVDNKWVLGIEADFQGSAQRASGPNLTFRFVWGFPEGLACASLWDAQANEHRIEQGRSQQA